MKSFLSLLGLLALLSFPATAHDLSIGDLTIKNPFARASAGPARAGAVFMGVRSNGDSSDRLMGVSISTDIAKKAEIHTHIMENDVAKMREVEGGIEIPAGGMIMLKPGGLHVMLMKLTEPLEEGETFMLTLEFEQAGEITLEIPILGVSAGAEPEMDTMDGMDHGTTSGGDTPTTGS